MQSLGSWDSVFGVTKATSWTAEESPFSSKRQEISLHHSRTLRPTQRNTQWTRELCFLGEECTGCEADHSPSPSAGKIYPYSHMYLRDIG